MRPHPTGLNLRHAEMQSWGRDKKSLLDTQACRNLDDNQNNNNSLGRLGTGRQDKGRSFYSLKDSGGASFFGSDCLHPPSSLQLIALEEGMDDKQKLQTG